MTMTVPTPRWMTGVADVAVGSVVLLLAAAGCGTSDGAVEPAATSTISVVRRDPAITTVEHQTLPPMEVVAALGYPRDLLDRGRVNIEISRDDDTDFVVFDKQLVADHYTPAPVEERRTELPPSGQVVALQTLFGDVADCDAADPVTAVLRVTFAYGADPTRRSTAIPLTDASTLDGIRSQKCTVRRVLADNEIGLVDAVVVDETMTADLVIRRRTGDDRLGIDAIKGTVLFGAETVFEPGSPERILEPDEPEQIIPLVIDVNRCDPHAVAETTRTYGIDLYISVDGADAQRFDVPIDPILDDLELMLDRCKRRTGQ